MTPRLKPRFTPAEGARLTAVAAELGLRPAQLAHRLLGGTRKLSPVPLANRQLWQELARTAANLTQLGWHLEASPTPQPALQGEIACAAAELDQLRRELLGLSPDGAAPSGTRIDDEDLDGAEVIEDADALDDDLVDAEGSP